MVQKLALLQQSEANLTGFHGGLDAETRNMHSLIFPADLVGSTGPEKWAHYEPA